MRIKLTVAAGVLLLSLAVPTWAQQATDAGDGFTGTIDVGARTLTTSGDEARYERFRDLRPGVFSDISLGKKTAAYEFGARAEKIGYRDQRYTGEYRSSKLRLTGAFDSIPLNYSYQTSTPWVQGTTGVFTLDAAARAQVQAKVAGVVGVPSSAAQLATPSIYRALATPFDLQSKRETASGGAAYDVTPSTGFNLSITSTKKSGQQPYGASFAFNNANELAIPVDNRTNDVSAGLEWSNTQGMVRLGWDASFFNNNVHEIIWDNPLRASDTTPFDASGYSNGNGPARGRMSMAPSNSMNVISSTGLYKMPSHTTINGTVSFTSMNQNDALIPWTSNAAIANAGVYNTYPGLARLPRETAEAKVHGLNAMFNLTSRPNKVLGLTMRYRFNDHRNLTPAFDAREYVRFDAAPSNTGSFTQNFSVRQNTYDMAATFNLAKRTALRLGYTYDDFNRTGRAFSDMRDYTFRASLDTLSNDYFTVRFTADHAERVGTGFSEASVEEGGGQPGLRFYDEADRDRNRGGVIAILTPMSTVDLTFQMTAGKDIYKGEGHDFGLLDNFNRTYNAGIAFTPRKEVSVGASVGQDVFNSLQRSRNANPPGSDYGSWTDPNRTWDLTNDEKVWNANAYLDLLKLLPKTDLRMSYDYSDSDNAFVHSGPRITALSTNSILTAGDSRPCAAGLTSCFEALPHVTNTWQRIGADAKVSVTAKVGLGLSFWHERFDVTDYATLDLPGQSGTPRIDYLGSLSTGYGNRPYRGNTGLIRLLYAF